MADRTLPTTIVIPTIGRTSLDVLLAALQAGTGPRPEAVVIVDDRPAADADRAPLKPPEALAAQVVRSGGVGPAAARNRGWRQARTPWVSFVDDDVLPDSNWLLDLEADLNAADDDTAGTQGVLRVPLPAHRRPTDWERGTAGLAHSAWITADMTYRRQDLERVGGFDERFPRAFREDADLALRVMATGRRLSVGGRQVQHPVRPADFWVSLRAQRGNADDALMTRLHGRDWWTRARAPKGRLPIHVLTTGAAAVAVGALLARRPTIAGVAATAWLVGTADFAWRRIRPGPRSPDEVRRMLVTSVLIPPAATWHAVKGRWIHRRADPWSGPPALVLFDRDGTLIHDVPYNGDPSRVRPVDDARAALDRLREHGLRVGIVTNQSGVALGHFSADQASAVNAEVERRLGPFDVVLSCPHAANDGCGCRKPSPGMVRDACRRLAVPVNRCVVVGDIRTDILAARNAGATGILVPTPATSADDVRDGGLVCPSLLAAVDRILGTSTAHALNAGHPG
jgi:HAD superfamily hydrolase (TIGR01662 family)